MTTKIENERLSNIEIILKDYVSVAEKRLLDLQVLIAVHEEKIETNSDEIVNLRKTNVIWSTLNSILTVAALVLILLVG